MLRIEVVQERQENYDKCEQTFSQPADVFLDQQLQAEFRTCDREKFIVLHLNTKNRLISYEVVSVGSLNTSIVHPREVFKAALLSNAASIILAHNHPSDDPNPSQDDRQLTKRLIEAGKLLGIEVLDHLIFASKHFYSFTADTLIKGVDPDEQQRPDCRESKNMSRMSLRQLLQESS